MRKKCPRCHQSNPMWAKFCQFCGRMLTEVTTTAIANSTTMRLQFIKSPKSCDNPECHGIIDSKDLRCPFCGSLQLKPHIADMIAARIINIFLGLILYAFFLETVFSQSILNHYYALSIFTIFIPNPSEFNAQAFQYLTLIWASYFLVILVGQLITKGQNIGFETVQVQLLRKKNATSKISSFDELEVVQGKWAIIWALIETFDMWTFFSLSLLTHVVSMLVMRDETSFFISDRITGGIILDKKKIERITKNIDSNQDIPVNT